MPRMPNVECGYRQFGPPPIQPKADSARRRFRPSPIIDGSGSAAHMNKQSHLERDADPQLSTIIRIENASYG